MSSTTQLYYLSQTFGATLYVLVLYCRDVELFLNALSSDSAISDVCSVI